MANRAFGTRRLIADHRVQLRISDRYWAPWLRDLLRSRERKAAVEDRRHRDLREPDLRLRREYRHPVRSAQAQAKCAQADRPRYLVNPDEADLGGKVGFIFGGLGLIGAGWTWLFIPETKNRTVDEWVSYSRRVALLTSDSTRCLKHAFLPESSPRPTSGVCSRIRHEQRAWQPPAGARTPRDVRTPNDFAACCKTPLSNLSSLLSSHVFRAVCHNALQYEISPNHTWTLSGPLSSVHLLTACLPCPRACSLPK